MMSLTFGLFTQVSGSGSLGPLVYLFIYLFNLFPEKNLHLHLKMTYIVYKIVIKTLKSLTYRRTYRSYV